MSIELQNGIRIDFDLSIVVVANLHLRRFSNRPHAYVPNIDARIMYELRINCSVTSTLTLRIKRLQATMQQQRLITRQARLHERLEHEAASADGRSLEVTLAWQMKMHAR